LLSGISRYFALERPVMGAVGVVSEIFLFTGVIAGTVGRWVISHFEQASYNWKGLMVGLIAAVITFPTIYSNAGLNRSDKAFVKWCVAFQNGYFWPVLLEQVGKAIAH
jgi:hypothetical protein